MKQKYKFVIIIAVLLFSVNIFAQNEIPNAGFENWPNLDPDLWTSTNGILGTNVTKTDDAHSGSWAAKGEVISAVIGGFPYPPGLFAGKQTTPGCCLPFPISQNYETFTGYYKSHVEGEDLGLGIIVTLHDVNFQLVAFGQGGFFVSNSFEQFTILMDYSLGNGNQAEFATIEFALGSDGNEVAYGSWWIVDDLTFEGNVSSVDLVDATNPSEFSLHQNYPNPFNPSTNINFSVPEESFVTLKVYNVQGKEIADLVNENLSTGNYNVNWDASALPSGVYVYMLRAKDIYLSRKMILMK